MSQLKMARDDEEEGEEETEGYWEEDSEEVDSCEFVLQVIIANQYEHPYKMKTICTNCGTSISRTSAIESIVSN